MVKKSSKFEQLIRHAKLWYGLEEEKARAILKEAGFNSFEEEKYFDYLNVLRLHWLEVIDLKEKLPEVDTKEVLMEKSASVKMVEKDDRSGWKYVGDPEALEAYWKLQDLLREENVRTCRQRWMGWTHLKTEGERNAGV